MCQTNNKNKTSKRFIEGYRIYDSTKRSFYNSYEMPTRGIPTVKSYHEFHILRTLRDVRTWYRHQKNHWANMPDPYIVEARLDENILLGCWDCCTKVKTATGNILTILTAPILLSKFFEVNKS